MRPHQPTLAKLQQDVHQALRLWHKPHDETNPLAYLCLYQQASQNSEGQPRQIANRILHQALTRLAARQPEAAELLNRRFLEQTPMYGVAAQRNLAESTLNKRQRQALAQLTQLIQEMEAQAQAERLADLERRLQLPPSTPLFGLESICKELLERLLAVESSWFISLEGLGGIGKTSLANALVRQLALTHRFADLVWVSAKQQDFWSGLGLTTSSRPALEVETLVATLLEQLEPDLPPLASFQDSLARLSQRLKQRSALIVIDNLETVLDYQTLLPTLHKLANPAKFLLTSRHSLQGYAETVYCFNCPELSQTDSLALLKHEAEVRRLTSLLNATPEHMAAIWQVVGGNPLALKLVAGQLHLLPLTQVLAALRQAQGQKIEALYTFIYRQSWQALSLAARQALLAMPLAQNGTFDQLLRVSRLEETDLYQAIEQLRLFSLLEIDGEHVDQPRYRIHRLTETFLLTELVKWPSPR